MKNLVLFIVCIYFTAIHVQSSAQIIVPYTAAEVLEKAIKFNDPKEKWQTYSGIVKLNTSFPFENTYGTEIIEIDVASDYYQCTRLAGGNKIVKGVKDGKIFRSVNGKTSLDEDELNDFGLIDQGILNMKEWHYFHFGKLAHFKNSGAILQDRVTRSHFKGKDCYVLTFIGDSSKVTMPRWAGEVIFFIDVKSFTINGIQWSSRGGYESLEGFLDINGIKLPRVRVSYATEDNSVQYVDVFTREEDNFNLPEGFRTISTVSGSPISLISATMFKPEHDEHLEKLNKPLKEINELLAKLGYPESGYVIYKVHDDYDPDFTHIMTGWWLNRETYDYLHNHNEYKHLTQKYHKVMDNILKGPTYFRMEKVLPDP